MRQPWICPKCNTAYAPWIDSCACQGVAIPQPIVWDKPITINDPILPPMDVKISYIGADGLVHPLS